MAGKQSHSTRRSMSRHSSVSASLVSIHRTQHELRIEAGPSPELPRTLVLRVQLRPFGALMDAAAYVGDALVTSTRFARVPVKLHEETWRLRPGVLAALVLGDTDIPLSPAEHAALLLILEPLGVTVLGPEGVRS